MKEMCFFILFCILLCNLSVKSDKNNNNWVWYKNGLIYGEKKISAKNHSYTAYLGIPYAKPPVGDLRFANPEAFEETLKNPFFAQKYAPRCIQKNYLFSQNPPPEGNEDCLYLNVYVPEIIKENSELFAVMVHIHYGGFFAGSSDDGYLDPEYFLDENVIVITFNYRLGVFGLLSTLDDEAPGNLALKDQVLALKWINKNIHFFGGNPKLITIQGQSAGAASVHLHMISESSSGLFQHAISQSGNALAPFALTNNMLQQFVVIQQAKVFQCNITSSKIILECLRQISAKDLIESQNQFKTFHRFPFMPWGLVEEKKTLKNPEPFLTDSVRNSLISGKFQKIPWLVGSVENEGLIIAASLLTVPAEIEEMNKNFSAILNQLLGLQYVYTDENVPEKSRKIVEFYLDNSQIVQPNNEEFAHNFINMFTDRHFTFPLTQSLKFHLDNGHNTIFLYNFQYHGEYTFGSKFSTDPENYALSDDFGAAHCDDLLYQFISSDIFPEIREKHDISLKNIWTKVWTNFAKTGNPNGVIKCVNWTSLKNTSNEEFSLLNVAGTHKSGVKFQITRGFLNERIQFWENL